jgi:hypothetical protein
MSRLFNRHLPAPARRAVSTRQIARRLAVSNTAFRQPRVLDNFADGGISGYGKQNFLESAPAACRPCALGTPEDRT